MKPVLKRLLVLSAVAGLMVGMSGSAFSATYLFDDVPPTSPFADDIAWLAERGITVGCDSDGPPLFCPGEHVTRGQMAAFLRRFAEDLAASTPAPTPPPSSGGGSSRPDGAVHTAARNSLFSSNTTLVNAGEVINLASVTLQPRDGAFVALNASAWGLSVASNFSDPNTGLPLVNSFGWLETGAGCTLITFDQNTGQPNPPPNTVPGSEMPLQSASFAPVNGGSVAAGLQLGGSPVTVHLCVTVQEIFGGEVIEFGSAGLTATQSSTGSVNVVLVPPSIPPPAPLSVE